MFKKRDKPALLRGVLFESLLVFDVVAHVSSLLGYGIYVVNHGILVAYAL